MAGQEVDQVFRHADGTHARAAPTVRNAKCLMEIKMANVRAHVARPAQSNLRVQVRTIHIDLSTVGVNTSANLLNCFFEYAMG